MTDNDLLEKSFAALDLVATIKDYCNSMDEMTFGAFYCMLAEEYCHANNKDVIELIDWIVKGIIHINERMGEY